MNRYSFLIIVMEITVIYDEGIRVIMKCPECGINYTVDEKGKPYYLHDHTTLGSGVTHTKHVHDRWGNLIVDFEKMHQKSGISRKRMNKKEHYHHPSKTLYNA